MIQPRRRPQSCLTRVVLTLLVGLMAFSLPGRGCTIFVLTDAERTLFFNNEDWKNPVTRLWFIQAGDGYYGCAYLGFDDGWAQGGVNTAGLAYDWVASGKKDKTTQWFASPERVTVRGNPTQRMLETCATVEEAITFYGKHHEQGFATARILLADKSGASAIIRAERGKLVIERDTRSRGFGYGGKTLEKLLARQPKPTVEVGAQILRACVQEGYAATKYANIFDLRTGDILMLPAPINDKPVKLNLATELKRGAHYFDIPKLREQVNQPPVPLLNNLKRFYLDEFTPAIRQDAAVLERIDRIMRGAETGTSRAEDYMTDLWSKLAGAQSEMRNDLRRFGSYRQAQLVEHQSQQTSSGQRAIVDFEKTRVLQVFTFDEQGKVLSMQTEALEWKPGMEPYED